MREDLEKYAAYLPVLYKAMKTRETEARCYLERGERHLPLALPSPPFQTYWPETTQELLEWAEAKRAIEKDFWRDKKPIRLFPGGEEEPEESDDSDFPGAGVCPLSNSDAADRPPGRSLMGGRFRADK